MRKMGLLVMILGLLLGFLFQTRGYAGMTRAEQLGKEDVAEQAMSDEMIQEIVTALDNQDKDALKALFSPYALEHATELDAGIQNAIEFYQGEHTAFQGSSSSAEKIEYGAIEELLLFGHYEVETTSGAYTIYFVYQPQHDTEKERVGLYALQIITPDFKTDGFYWVNENNAPGVYVQCSG